LRPPHKMKINFFEKKTNFSDRYPAVRDKKVNFFRKGFHGV